MDNERSSTEDVAARVASKAESVAATVAAKVEGAAYNIASALGQEARRTDQINSQTFSLLMARFDTLERQNDEQMKFLQTHIRDYEKTRTIVERHSTYFSILALGIPVGIAALVHKMGWKGL